MNFIVIRGGLSDPAGSEISLENVLPSAADVRREGQRRIAASGYPAFHARYLATGVPIPATIRYRQLQISYAAEAIARLKPIPADFHADEYWPG